MDDQRTAFRRVGNLSSQRIARPIPIASMHRRPAGGLGSTFNVPMTAVHRGNPWAMSLPTMAFPAPTSGMTARRIHGSSSASGIWSLRSPIPDTVYAGVEDAALFRSTDGGKIWQELSGLRGHGIGSALAAGRGWNVSAHDHPRSEQSRSASSSRFRPRRVPHR